jgi:hypothetical protein
MTITATEKRVTARPTTPNILRAFGSATLDEIHEGRAWYRSARNLASELVEQYGTKFISEDDTVERAVERAVGVIAVLSPRLSWTKNVELARWIYREASEAWLLAKPSWWVRENGSVLDRFPGLKANGQKAIDILLGASPEEVVSGPKVTAFYHAIANPNDPRGIVIDRHAFDVAVGRVMDDRTRGVVLGRKGAYEQFVRAYERAAEKLQDEFPGITPAEVQAITWLAWRRQKKEA